MDIADHVAATLKNLRTLREWSLTKTAEETGVSKAMLGQIERGESSPTISTLWKIATGFNVPFSVFIDAPAVAPKPAYGSHQSMEVTSVFPYDDQLRFDMLEVILAAGASSDSTPHDYGVIEHVVVIDGQLDLSVDGELLRLQAGEGKRFAGDQPHGYHNSGDRPARFYSMIHYPAQAKD